MVAVVVVVVLVEGEYTIDTRLSRVGVCQHRGEDGSK